MFQIRNDTLLRHFRESRSTLGKRAKVKGLFCVLKNISDVKRMIPLSFRVSPDFQSLPFSFERTDSTPTSISQHVSWHSIHVPNEVRISRYSPNLYSLLYAHRGFQSPFLELRGLSQSKIHSYFSKFFLKLENPKKSTDAAKLRKRKIRERIERTKTGKGNFKDRF